MINQAEVITKALQAGLRLPPNYTVSEWADETIMLPSEMAAEPGRWRTDRAPYQREMMDVLTDRRIKIVVIKSSAQIGKGLCLKTDLPTPHGWTTMADVKVGTELYDESGSVCRVTYVSPVHNIDCYRVTFSDGSQVTCDKDHLWHVESDTCLDKLDFIGQDIRGMRVDKRTVGTLGIEDIYKFYRYPSRSKNSDFRYRFAVPVAQAISGSRKDDETLISGYVLGLWLGDGGTKSNTIFSGLEDVVEISKEIISEGYRISLKEARTCWAIKVDPGRQSVNVGRGCESVHRAQGATRALVAGAPGDFGCSLSALGVRGRKHIPEAYLRAETSVRFSLLQGLMDSDGYISKNGRCEFTTSNDDLAEGFGELLGSLGIKFTCKPKKAVAVVDGEKIDCGNAWRFSFLVYSDTPVFRLKRKLDKMVSREGRRTTKTERRRIVNVEKVPSVPTRCIQVDSPNSLFLCSRNFIPTHNTSVLLNGISYFICHEPAPMLMIQPTLEMAEAFNNDKLEPLIRSTPALSEKVGDEKSRSSANTKKQKQFPGGFLRMVGANSPTSLRMHSVKLVFADEINAYPRSSGNEGDPVKLAVKRMTTFPDSTLLLTSTPTVKGLSRISEFFEKSDKRFYNIPCPDCSTFQKLEFENIIWEKGDPYSAHYACPHCGTLHSDHVIKNNLKHGVWKAEGEPCDIAGFHIWELYSPFSSMAKIVREYEDSRGLPNDEKVFVNTVLGEDYDSSEGTSVTAEQLFHRREEIPEDVLPGGVVCLTVGVDVQGDRLECLTLGHGIQNEKWVIDFTKIYGRPDTEAPWLELEELLLRRFTHPSGHELIIEAAAIDSGYSADTVYKFSKKALGAGRRWYAIKGVDGESRPAWTQSDARIKFNAKLYIVGVDSLKTSLYSRLSNETPGADYIHFPVREQLTVEWFEQLIHEKVIIENDKNGYPRRVWINPNNKRNEAMDIMNYAEAAHSSLNVDHEARLSSLYQGRKKTAADVARKMKGLS